MRFEIQAPDGKVFEIEGDAIPTETELNNIFSAMSSQESINNISKPSVDITKVKASDMMGEQGFDNKPFEKLNNYIQKITEVKVNEDADYSIKDAWEGFKNNLFKFEVRKSNEKPEGAQVLEDTAVEALDIGKQYAEATKKAVVNADIKDLGKGTKEVSKALGRATAEFTIGGVGKVVSMVGDLMYDETDITNISKFEAYKIKGGNFTAETYKKIGRYLQDLSDMAVQSDILKEDPEIFSGSFVENPSLTRLVSFGTSAVPSLFTAGGLHKLGVPNKLNGMILAGLESSDVYGEAREAGKGKGEALGLFALSSAGTAYLETKGLDNLFDNKMKSLAGRMLTTMGSEGFTEYWQTVYQNAVKKYGYDATQDLFEGGFEALIGGIIGGGGAQVVNTSFDKFSKRADKYGVTQEEKMAILNAVSNETNAKSEQLNAMFQSNYDKSMKTLEEYINTNKDEAAVAQAVEKKQQLEKIYNDSYNELKNIMPEQEAKSNAALIRNSAFFYANEFGISPEEFIKKRGVKVVKSDYNSFRALDGDYIPYQFAGPNAKTAVLDRLNDAKRMFDNDALSMEEIRQQTGWFRGEDKKWRFEISDKDASIDKKTLNLLTDTDKEYGFVLSDLLKHDNLYDAYPNFEGINIIVDPSLKGTSTGASLVTSDYSGKEASELTDEDRANLWLRIKINPDILSKDSDFIKSVLLHEVQHAIQKREGFASGGSVQMFKENKDTFQQILQEMSQKEYIQSLYDEMYSKFGVKEADAILDADEKHLKASLEWGKAIFNENVAEDSEEEIRLEKKVDETEEYLKTSLENAGLTMSEFGKIKLDARKKAGMDIFGKVKDVERYDEFNLYQRLYGEIEARNTQARANMSNEERKTTPVEETQDVENADAIVVFDDGSVAAYNGYNPNKVRVEEGVVDLSDAFEKTPTHKEVEEFINKAIEEGIKFKTLSPDFFIDFATRKKAIKKLKNNGNYKHLSESQQRRLNKYIVALEKIAENAKQLPPFTGKNNTKLEAKPDVEKYYYFEANVRFGDKVYTLLLNAEKNKVDSENKPQTVHLYDISENKKAGVKHDITRTSIGTPTFNKSMPQFQTNVNRTFYQESLNIAVENAELDKVNPAYEGETININGVERTVYNSNGDRIAMSEPALRNFYNWFGDSKAVNEYGEPLDLFHGTGFEFDAFDGSKPIFLSDSKDVAQWFAIYGKGTVEGRNIKTVYAKISNPLVVDAKGALFGDIEFNGQRLSAEDISNYAKENGYDGVIINNVKEAGSAEILSNDYVVFNPNQIKSTSNRGTYSESDNIYMQGGANDPKGAYVNRIIYLFQNADASTLPHELAHFWKDTLKDAAKMSKRAAKMLEDVEKWAEQEFNRKYSVQLKDGRYVVNNKQGLTVYDHNFRTEADAKEYAKEELFAQGNEAFLREGVAPNNSLKQAFRNFLNWLKHIYNQARQLDIRLSPEIRQVYADILGGTEIDFFLNTDPDTFVENRIKLDTETVKTLDEQIAEAQRMGVSVSEPDGRGLKHVWETAMIPLSTRLGRISNKLKNRLRRYEFDIANSLNHYYNEARPFLQKWKTFSEMDTIAFDIALKNDYVKKQLEIVDKYGAREEWEKVRKLLLDIFDSAVKAGLDVNFRPDYFPRKVKDVQGFLSYLRGRPEWTKFEEALRDADPDHTFTAEEQADFINKYLRGFIKVDLMPYKYGSEKQRSIEIINNEMNKYYAPSMESLVSYIEGMNARIEASKFLGRDAENLDASVGGYLDYLINNNEIDPNKVDEVKEILKARFNQKGVGNKWIAGARNISYMYTMGGINSAITQIEDLSVSMYKAGVWNTLTTAFENKKIKRADLGLDKISAEFVENPSRTAKGVDKLFKLTGLDKIDSFGKETLVNAMVKKFKKMSEESLRQYIEPIMEQETTQTIQDIKNGEMSDNVLYLVFSELSDVQPISLSELPAFYNTSGNLRILYMLKSFMIKRIDIFRNECFDKLRSKSKEARIQGMQNLFRLALLMIFCGVSKDWLINMLYGRKMDIPETVVNNALGLVGFSKFHAYQLRDKGAGEVIKDFLMPPMFAPYDDLLGDIWRIGKGKRDLKDAESFKGIPLIGRFYYWHIGRGKEKMKKKNKSKLK